MKLKRALATGAAVLVTGFSLTACGDDDGGDNNGGGGSDSGDAGDAGDAPTDASSEDFCKVFTDMSELDGSDAPEDQADVAHDLADKLAEVGTPEDIDENERNGFELWVEFLADVNADDIEKLNEADPNDPNGFSNTLGLDEADIADVTAFFTYAATSCAPEMPTDIPTEDLPTDVPTEGLPTDIPTQ